MAGETYRLWPATNGPASAAADTTGYSLSTEFEITGPANVEGFFWWCANGADTTPKTFQVFALTSLSTGTAVPGTLVTSGTLTQNAWNAVALPDPVPLVIGQRYRAVVFFAGGANWYSSTSNGWLADLVQGPLKGLSTANALGNIQGGFRTSAGVIDVSNGSVGSNYWVDLLVRDATPIVDLGPASTEDGATPLATTKLYTLGVAAEAVSAQPTDPTKVRVLGAAATEDTAGGLAAHRRYSLAPAAEEVQGAPTAPRKTTTLGASAEAVAAGRTVGAPGLRLLLPAHTIDWAGALQILKRRPADTLQPSTTSPVLTVGTTGPTLTAVATTGGS